jgi:hypothetical protein
MGYGAPHMGFMVRVGGPYYDDSDDDELSSAYSDKESEVSDWDDNWEEFEHHSATPSDLSVVLTLPLDVIYEVCNTHFPWSNLNVSVSFFCIAFRASQACRPIKSCSGH